MESGENLRKNRTSDASTSGPFKKAKHIGQLKGQRHLKENTSLVPIEPNNNHPVNSVPLQVHNNDNNIATNIWCAREMARSCVENTINTVMDEWRLSSEFDAEDLVENCENDGQVLDKGIMMAIRSHGLSIQQSPEGVESGQASAEDPADFMNAALSAAIQRKGLNTC